MKGKLLLCFITVLGFLVAGEKISAQSPATNKSVMTAVKIDKQIEMTGKLDDPIWQTAVPIELGYEVMPGENIKAPQRTIVRALYNDKNLYFGYQCFDTDPEQIRANISDRDKIFQDDFVGLMLDTYGDLHRAYELMVNPYGIKADLMRTGDNEDESFDMIWETAAAKDDKGWTAIMSIPFSSINFPGQEEQVWNLVVMRIIPRASRSQISWTPYDRNIPNFLAQSGVLKGIKNIKSGGAVELLPYLMGQKSGYLSNSNNPNSGIKYDPIIGRFGGGIKYSPSGSFQLDAVINPDFSQIESDADQISVNTTFALQYDEKRPFFLNGRELFNTPVYYSRSINDPLWAGRIMGKSGAATYYLMTAYDRNTVYTVPGEEMSSTIPTTMKSIVNVGRIRYEIGKERHIGGMLLTRNMDGGNNYDIGFDWGYRFWENWNFQGEIHLSQTKELNDTTLFNSQRKFGSSGYNAAFNGEKYTGTGINMQLSYSGRSYSFGVECLSVTPTFQAYNGIVTSNASQGISMEHDYTLYPVDSFFDRIQFSVGSNLRFNFEGEKKEQVVTPGVYIELKGQTSVSFSYLLVNDENFFNTDLTGVNRFQFNINSRPIKEVSIFLNGRFGNFIYRSSNPAVGSGHDLSATLQLKPTSQLDISFSYTRANLKNKKTNGLYYDGNIYRAVGIYQFTPELLFRTIVQYNTFDKSFQLYPLFSYKMNAFTTFFAGTTSNYYNYEGEYGFKNTEQQYFIKVQYLLGI